MPELSKDDFQTAMDESFMGEQIQRQTEMLQSLSDTTEAQVQAVEQGGPNVGTAIEGEAMLEKLDQLQGILSPQGIERPAVDLSDDTIDQISESLSESLPEIPDAGMTGEQAEGGMGQGVQDSLDTMVQQQEEGLSFREEMSEQFGEVGEHLAFMKEGVQGIPELEDAMQAGGRGMLAEKLQEQIENENMTNDQLMALGEKMQALLAEQEESELSQQFSEQMLDLTTTIEEETGEPMVDVRQELTQASGQMSLGDMMANKFAVLTGSVRDGLSSLKESFMAGLNTLKDGLMGVFEGGQSIGALMATAFSSVLSGLGTLIAGALGYSSIGEAVIAGITSAFSGVSMSTAIFGTGGLALGAGVAMDLFFGTGKTAGILGMAIDNLGGVLPLIQWLFGIETDLSVSNMISSMFGLEDFSLGEMFARRFSAGAEGIHKAFQTLIIDPLSSTVTALMSPIDSLQSMFSGMLSVGSDVVDWFGNLGGTLGNMFMDGLKWLSSQIGNFFDQALDTLGSIGDMVLEVPGMIFNLQKQMLSMLVDGILSIPTSILGAVESGLRMVGMDSVADGIGLIKQAITNLPNTIMSALKNLPGMIVKAVKTIPGKITKAIYELPSMIWNKMTQLPSMLASKLSDLMPGAEDIPGAETASNVVSGAGDVASSIGSAIGFAEGGVIKEPTIGVGTKSGQVKTFAEKGPEVVVPTAQATEGTPPDTSGGTERMAQQGAPESSEVMLSGAFSQDGSGDGRDSEKIQWLKKIYGAIENIAPNTGDNTSSVPSGLTDTQALRISRGVL